MAVEPSVTIHMNGRLEKALIFLMGRGKWRWLFILFLAFLKKYSLLDLFFSRLVRGNALVSISRFSAVCLIKEIVVFLQTNYRK